MATPNVTGSLLLVTEHHRNVTGNFMSGAALKGLVLHTTDDAGAVGPDVNFGWGLLNVKKMIEEINNRNTTALFSNNTLINGGRDTIWINSDGIQPLRASISWYDRAGAVQTSSQLNNSTIKRLVNDLDLRVINTSNNTIYYPWVLISRSTNAKQDNDRDNFERVDVGVVPAGQYAVVITHKGTLTGSRQDYSLLITGRSNNVVACNAPSNATVTNITNNNATISWQAPTTATTGYTLEYKSASSNTWNTAYTGANTSFTLTNIAASTSYEYRVNANCGNNNISTYTTGTFTTLANPTCAAPTNLVANNITISSATLTWAASTSANNGYTVSYKPSSSSNWTVGYTCTNTTISISNLSASTAYDWRVVTNCSYSLTSNPATSSFTTAGAPIVCNTPTNAQVSNITYNSANTSWTASSSTIQSYSLEYKLSTNTTWTTAYTGTNLNFVLSNLTANSTYNYRIKANCTSTNSSDYISGNFVTSQLPICKIWN